MILTIHCVPHYDYDGFENIELLKLILLKKLHSNSEEDIEILNKKKSILFLIEIFNTLQQNNRNRFCEVNCDFSFFIKKITEYIDQFPNIVFSDENQELYLCQMIAIYFNNIRDQSFLKESFQELDNFLKYFLKDGILEEFFENFTDSKPRNAGVLLRLLQLDLKKMENKNFSPLSICDFWLNFNNWRRSYYFNFNSRLKNLTEIEKYANKYLEKLVVKENIKKLQRIGYKFNIEFENKINHKKINKILVLMIKNILDNPKNNTTDHEADSLPDSLPNSEYNDINFILSYFIKNSIFNSNQNSCDSESSPNELSSKELSPEDPYYKNLEDSIAVLNFMQNPEEYYEEFLINDKVGVYSQFIVIARYIVLFYFICGDRFVEFLDILRNFELSKEWIYRFINLAGYLIHNIMNRDQEYIPKDNLEDYENILSTMENFIRSSYFTSFFSNIIYYYKNNKS